MDPRTNIGHVRLTVADLDRSIAFYSGVLGFQVTQRMGASAVFLGVGGSDHIILTTPDWRVGRTAAPGTSGPFRFAIRYPDRASLGDALRRLRDAKVNLDGATDHGVSEALYIKDPDGFAIELYWDRPRDQWSRTAGGAVLIDEPLDLAALLRDAAPFSAGSGSATGADGSLSVPLTDTHRQQLRDLRTKLLNLHQALLDDARVAYELDRGAVGSNTNLLQLVINDPWFAWLHSVSELVVRIDETIELKSPATDKEGVELAEQVEKLLTASETGTGFQRRYFEALQRQPAVVLAHADVRRTLKSMKD
jgi:catechol 2,3-dioxygenase